MITTYIEMSAEIKAAIAAYLEIHKELDQDQLIALAIAEYLEARKNENVPNS